MDLYVIKHSLGDISNYYLRVNTSKIGALFWCLAHSFCATALYLEGDNE